MSSPLDDNQSKEARHERPGFLWTTLRTYAVSLLASFLLGYGGAELPQLQHTSGQLSPPAVVQVVQPPSSSALEQKTVRGLLAETVLEGMANHESADIIAGRVIELFGEQVVLTPEREAKLIETVKEGLAHGTIEILLEQLFHLLEQWRVQPVPTVSPTPTPPR